MGRCGPARPGSERRCWRPGGGRARRPRGGSAAGPSQAPIPLVSAARPPPHPWGQSAVAAGWRRPVTADTCWCPSGPAPGPPRRRRGSRRQRGRGPGGLRRPRTPVGHLPLPGRAVAAGKAPSQGLCCASGWHRAGLDRGSPTGTVGGGRGAAAFPAALGHWHQAHAKASERILRPA